ncbi:hypothetical protein ACFE04_015160 [Oxalis oulophora]
MPKEFVRDHGDSLSDPVFLEDPAGETWSVKLTNHNGDLWLEDGWKEFADHYSLGFGHLVIFKYEGNSLFKVVIFEQNASEISYPLPGPAHSGESDETETDERKGKEINTTRPQTRYQTTKASTTLSSSRVLRNRPVRVPPASQTALNPEFRVVVRKARDR